MGLQADGVGRAQVSKVIYGWTDMQDLRMVLGAKVHVDQKGTITPVRSPRPLAAYASACAVYFGRCHSQGLCKYCAGCVWASAGE